jgi:peroxiredoxin
MIGMLRTACRFPAALLFVACTWAAAPQFGLHDTRGAEHTPAEWNGKKAVLLLFVTTDCPVANSYVPEMNRIHDDYAARGVLVWAVQADPTVPAASVVQYAHDYHYGFPLVLDLRQSLVSLAGATITPQAAILSPEGKVLYLGRIDNRVADFGQLRFKATVPDLRNALDEVLAGKPVAVPYTKSIGCAINRIKP